MNDSIINSIISLAKADLDITAIWLYGSRATDNFSAESDYDIAVLFASRISDPLDNRLRPELLAMDWQRNTIDTNIEISVIDVNQVMIPLAFNAISGRLLYCRNDGLRMSAEAIISSKAELDFHHASVRHTNHLTTG
jgi:predicted nucleotidyltransferase